MNKGLWELGSELQLMNGLKENFFRMVITDKTLAGRHQFWPATHLSKYDEGTESRT